MIDDCTYKLISIVYLIFQGDVAVGKSLFSVYRAGLASKPMDLDDAETSNVTMSPSKAFGDKSYILSNEMASSIHKENVEQLEKMDQSDILAEREQLIASLGFFLSF